MRWLLLLLSCLQLCMLASLSSTLRPVGLPGSNLPAEWKTARDRQGREYYYHARTKKATWTYPERKSLIFNNFPIETTILPNFFLLRVRPAEEFVSLLENKTKAVVVFHLPLAVRDPYFNNSFTRLSQTQRLGYHENEAKALDELTDRIARTNSSSRTPYITWNSPFTIEPGSFYHFRSAPQSMPAILSGRLWMQQQTCGTFQGMSFLMKSNELYMHLFLMLGGPWLFEKCNMRYTKGTVVKCCLSSDVEARECCIGGISERARCADVIQVRDSAQVSLKKSSLLLAGDIGRSIRSYGAGRAVVVQCHLELGAFAATLDDYSSIVFEDTCIQHFKVSVFHCMHHARGGNARIEFIGGVIRSRFLWFNEDRTTWIQREATIEVEKESGAAELYTKRERSLLGTGRDASA